jgi:hypothetical protein
MVTGSTLPGWPPDAEFAPPGQAFRYVLYGLQIDSQIRLPVAEADPAGPPDVQVLVAAVADIDRRCAGTAPGPDGESWYRHARLPDGGMHLRWENMFACIVAGSGRTIWFASLGAASMESLHVYFLGHAIAVALAAMGEEPLHATVVARPGRCVALMGESGAGKSTLAAYLVSRGARLVTDDLLRTVIDAGGVSAYPGPRRIKLMPDSKERYLGAQAEGVPMHPLSGKFILPLDVSMTHEGTPTLDEIVVLDWAPEDVLEPRLEAPTQRDAMLRVIAGTGVTRVTDAARLARQFKFAQDIVERVPVRRLLQPNDLERLPETAALIGFP